MKNLAGPFCMLLLLGMFSINACKKKNKDPQPAPSTTTTTGGTTAGGCPTTSACGCSSKSKQECEQATQCCKWTVGQGCGCK